MRCTRRPIRCAFDDPVVRSSGRLVAATQPVHYLTTCPRRGIGIVRVASVATIQNGSSRGNRQLHQVVQRQPGQGLQHLGAPLYALRHEALGGRAHRVGLRVPTRHNRLSGLLAPWRTLGTWVAAVLDSTSMCILWPGFKVIKKAPYAVPLLAALAAPVVSLDDQSAVVPATAETTACRVERRPSRRSASCRLGSWPRPVSEWDESPRRGVRRASGITKPPVHPNHWPKPRQVSHAPKAS